jgi:hypothetical protein
MGPRPHVPRPKAYGIDRCPDMLVPLYGLYIVMSRQLKVASQLHGNSYSVTDEGRNVRTQGMVTLFENSTAVHSSFVCLVQRPSARQWLYRRQLAGGY